MQNRMIKNGVSSSPKKTNKKKKNSGNSSWQGLPRTSTPRTFKGLSHVYPPRMSLRLKFNAIPAFSLAATGVANYRFRPTGAFDVDPALGGTSMAGFVEAAAIYASYRVVSSEITVTASNPSNVVPITMVVLPMNADPTNSFSAANVVASVGQPYARTKVLPLLGGGEAITSTRCTTAKIYGDPAVFYESAFASLVSTVPANNWYWNICMYSPAVIAAAIYPMVEITCECEFFDRYFLPT